MKTYKYIEFEPASNIERAVKELSTYKERGELVYGTFNGVDLHSDIDDLDSAYRRITGKTKSEFDEAEKNRQDEYEAELKIHEDLIPELTKEWIKRGHEILDEKYHDLWDECVPIRLGDLYRGMELGATLDIVKVLNEGVDFKIAKSIINGQGHSGMSHGLVCSMIKAFCDRGNDFVNSIR